MNELHINNRLKKIILHLLFNLMGAIITLNLTFISYQDSLQSLGTKIYILGAFSYIIYFIAIYSNYFFLTPQLLLKGRVKLYFLSLFIAVFALPTLSIAIEYFSRNYLNLPHRITSYANPLILIDSLSTTIITLICFCAVSGVMLLNKWKENQIKESQLTIENYKLNLNKFKSAIMPDFLSETLVKAANLAQVNPDQAYEILLNLSRLLRYHLYENNSNLVNINKEIENLDLFLKLESVNKENFNYKINRCLSAENTKVAPMYFISLVKDYVFSNTYIEILIDQQMRVSVVSNKSHLN